MNKTNMPTPQQLFERAAQLIEQALIQLDTKSAECITCGHILFHNVDQANLYRQFTDTPTKLRTAVEIMNGSVSPDGSATRTHRGYGQATGEFLDRKAGGVKGGRG